MSQIVESACKSFVAGAAIARCARVKISSGKVVTAGLADKDIGTAEYPAFADGDPAGVRLRSAQGTAKAIAAKAFAAGVELFTAANGKVSDTYAATSYYYGTSLEAATADGDIIEVLRASHGDTAGSGT